jgi:hypothetical protein
MAARRNFEEMPSHPMRFLAFCFIALPGIFLTALYFGLIPYEVSGKRTYFCNGQHWQLLSIGLAFFCAALRVALPPRAPALILRICELGLVVLLIAGVAGTFATDQVYCPKK